MMNECLSIEQTQNGTDTFTITSDDFLYAIERVYYAINPREKLAKIKGVHLRFGDEKIYFMAYRR